MESVRRRSNVSEEVHRSETVSSAIRRSSSSPPQDTLSSSCTEMLCSCFFTCFTFVIFKGVSFIGSFFQTKGGAPAGRGVERKKELERVSQGDLTKPEELRDFFIQDPYTVIRVMLEQLEADPDYVEKALVNLAKAWKANPDDYCPYSKDRRKTWITNLDGVMMKLLLTPRQQEVNDWIIHYDELGEDEVSALSDSDEQFAKRRGSSPQARETRRTVKEMGALKKDFKENLWGFCTAKMLAEDEDRFSDLTYYKDMTQGISAEEQEITVGVFLEALMFSRRASHLQGNQIYNEWVGYFSDILRVIMTHRTDRKYVIERFPRLKLLIEKMQGILSDDEKYERLQQIVSRVTAIFQPSGKSPKRSDSPVVSARH